MNAAHVQAVLEAYLGRYPEDTDRMAPIENALAEDDGKGLSSRNSDGHLTAGAIVVDGKSGAVLQIKHLKLKSWLFPGGHVEPGDLSLAEAARRELEEETGAIGRKASLAADCPVDIDVHPIPARPDGSESEHLHFDFRFLFTTTSDEDIQLAKSEVGDFRWTSCEELGRIGQRVESLLSVYA